MNFRQLIEANEVRTDNGKTLIVVPYKDILKQQKITDAKNEAEIVDWINYAGEMLRDYGNKKLVDKIQVGQ
jgi:hypothetical protein